MASRVFYSSTCNFPNTKYKQDLDSLTEHPSSVRGLSAFDLMFGKLTLTTLTISRSSLLTHLLPGITRTMTTAKEQPVWRGPPTVPAGVDLPPLKIYNSLTRSKTPFVPIKAKEKKVTWYVCGPTVYDDAHLGHSRNYVTSDIIRRIMKDYFGFKLKYVMNITDVDDKVKISPCHCSA